MSLRRTSAQSGSGYFLRGLSLHSLSAKRHSIRVFQAVSIAPNEHAREAKAVIG
jgi:hypothetical protein